MKLTTIVLVLASLSISSATHAQQNKDAEKAREKMAKAQKQLNTAIEDSTADYTAFVTSATQRIAENKTEIAALKQIKQDADDKTKAQYQKKLAVLETENNKLEQKIKDSKNTMTTLWQHFKANFNRDMNKLGAAIKSI